MPSLVSIVITCYNQGRFLKDAIGSLINQSYTHWECIIVNDGSTDETERIALHFCEEDKRFQYAYQANAGVSPARNHGVKLSSGKYIQFLDADDLLEAEKIRGQVDFLDGHPWVNIVYGTSRYFFDGNPADLYPVHYRAFAPAVEMHHADRLQKEVLVSMNVCTICAPLYRRSIFDKVEGFKPVPFEDWLFHIECSLHNFVFHFERVASGHCLIRITEQSQMERHRHINYSSNGFDMAFQQLLDKHGFHSQLIKKRTAQQALHTPPMVQRVVRNLLPPIFFKALAKVGIRNL